MEGKTLSYDPRPSKCPLCGGCVTYGKMADFNIRSYQSGWCYRCESCGAFVATHKNRPKDALGMLAKHNARKLRFLCHEEFDKHWMSTRGRNMAYYRLSKEMGIDKEDCHFGYMDEEHLKEAYEILQGWGNLFFR